MEMHVTGQPVLGELRQHVLAALLNHPLFSEAEQSRANYFVHESEDIARLTRWYTNALAEIAHHRVVAPHQRRRHTLYVTLGRLNSTSYQGHLPRQTQPAPTWVLGAPRVDWYAGTYNHLVACFQSQQFPTLTLITRVHELPS